MGLIIIVKVIELTMGNNKRVFLFGFYVEATRVKVLARRGYNISSDSLRVHKPCYAVSYFRGLRIYLGVISHPTNTSIFLCGSSAFLRP